MTSRRLTNKEIEGFIIETFEWTPNENQRVGVAFDATTKKGKRVEIKADKASSVTGQFFLEYAQTFDDWDTTKRSGIALACRQADFICLANGTLVLMLEAKNLGRWLETNTGRLQHRKTVLGSNGNRSTSFAVGVLVPVGTMVQQAKAVYLSTNTFTTEWRIEDPDDLEALRAGFEKRNLPLLAVGLGWAVNPFET